MGKRLLKFRYTILINSQLAARLAGGFLQLDLPA